MVFLKKINHNYYFELIENILALNLFKSKIYFLNTAKSKVANVTEINLFSNNYVVVLKKVKKILPKYIKSSLVNMFII